MVAQLKVAVIGTGSLGKEHARIYSDLARTGAIELTGVFDTAPEAAERIAQRYSTRRFKSLSEAREQADVFSIVTPTQTHYQLAKEFLEARKHVLIEKPMTNNSAEAAELVEIAQRQRVLLQVGHVERFNPVFGYLERVATDP